MYTTRTKTDVAGIVAFAQPILLIIPTFADIVLVWFTHPYRIGVENLAR